MYTTENFKWKKNNKLYCGRRYTGIYLQKHPELEELYYLCLYDRKIDYYNLTRAKDNGKHLATQIGRIEFKIPLEALLKPVERFSRVGS